PDAEPVRLDLADFVALQREADSRVRSGTDANFSSAQRAKLRALSIGAHTVGEGDLVSVTGDVAGKPGFNAGESVNCYLNGAANNDFEIGIASTPAAPARDAIIVEMIPQNRP